MKISAYIAGTLVALGVVTAPYYIESGTDPASVPDEQCKPFSEIVSELKAGINNDPFGLTLALKLSQIRETKTDQDGVCVDLSR